MSKDISVRREGGLAAPYDRGRQGRARGKAQGGMQVASQNPKMKSKGGGRSVISMHRT